MKREVIVTENELSADVLAAIEQGRNIEAIKILREQTGLGLANAKVLVDRAARAHGPEKPILTFEDPSHGMRKIVMSIAMVLLLVAAYFLYTGA